MFSSHRRLHEPAGLNSVIRSIDADDKIVKTRNTIQESLSKLYRNTENKIHKFILLKTISHKESVTHKPVVHVQYM
jgi:hypothetical protein